MWNDMTHQIQLTLVLVHNHVSIILIVIFIFIIGGSVLKTGHFLQGAALQAKGLQKV